MVPAPPPFPFTYEELSPLTALIEQGKATDYADLARQLGLTRARVTQIMALLHLAPDLQAAVLAWPPVCTGRDPIGEKAIRRIAREPLWERQRELWQQLPQPEDTPDAHQPSEAHVVS